MGKTVGICGNCDLEVENPEELLCPECGNFLDMRGTNDENGGSSGSVKSEAEVGDRDAVKNFVEGDMELDDAGVGPVELRSALERLRELPDDRQVGVMGRGVVHRLEYREKCMASLRTACGEVAEEMRVLTVKRARERLRDVTLCNGCF